MELWDSTQIICRVCLTETEEFQTIFTSVEVENISNTMPLSEMICSFSRVQMTLEDGLPEQICLSCAKETIKTYFFILRCEESDRLLRNKLLKLRNNKEEIVRNLDIMKNNHTENNEDTLPDNINSDVFEEGFEKNIEDIKHEEEDIEEDNSENTEEIKDSDNVDVEIVDNFPMDNTSHTIILKSEVCLQLNTCILCNHIFVNEETLEKHLAEDHMQVLENRDEAFFICKVCNHKMNDLHYFRTHILKHHDIQMSNFKYSCPYCFLKYTKEGHLKNHLKFHELATKCEKNGESAGHPCKYCTRNFITKEELSRHLKQIKILSTKLVSKKKPHVCETCHKAFNQITRLKDHLRTHSGEKPFLCPTCGKGFNQSGNLKQHQARHSEVKTHICSTCGNSFVSKGDLHAHLKKHTGEKPYECDYCKRKFTWPGLLSRHRRIHTGEKPHICKFCKKAFTQSNDLNSHIRVHTGEKPYFCDQCGQSFRQSSALGRHKKTHLVQKMGKILEKKLFMEDQEQI